MAAQDLGGENARTEGDLFLVLVLLVVVRLGRRVGKFRLEALEEVAEALGRNASLLEDAHGMAIGLSLGHARIAQLGQQQADIGGRAGRSGEHELRRSRQAHGPDQPGFGMKLDRMADLMRQHTGHLVRGGGFLYQPARHDDLAAGRGEGIDQRPVDHHHPHRRGVARCRNETARQAVERDSAGPLSHCFMWPVSWATTLRPIASRVCCGSIRAMVWAGCRLEEPHGGNDRCHDGDGRDARPQTQQTLACRRQAARARQQGLAERGVCDEKGLRAVGFQAQHDVGCVGR